MKLTTRLQGWKEILHIAWPLIIANAFWNFQITIDRIFLGNFSADALAASIAVTGVFWTPMALLQQTAAYITTFIAQYSGSEQHHKIGPALWQSIYLSIIGGLLFLLLIPLAPYLFSLFGHSPQLQTQETEYFQALCFSALPTALVACATGFFTGIERTQVIMRINAVGMVGNIGLDYLMIFGNFGFPRMGVAGAGLATAIATLLAAIYGFSLIFNQHYQNKYSVRSGWHYSLGLMQRYLRFGVPSGLQWALEGLAFTVFLIYIGRMPNGAAALAASGITVTIMMLSVLPCLGIAQSVLVLVGKHLGEKRPDLAQQSTYFGLQVSVIYIVTMGISFVLFPNFYLNWFHNDENKNLWEQISQMVPYLLMFVALFTIFDCMNLIFSFALKGAGDTRFVSTMALLLPWPLMILPTWLVSSHINGIYWSWAAASFFIIFQSFIFWLRFKGGKWKTMSVIN